MNDVPGLVHVAIVHTLVTDITPLCWQSFRWLRQFQTCVLLWKFSLNIVNWNTVWGALQDLQWHNIWSADNHIEVLNEHLLLLVGRTVPTKVIGMQNKDMPWFDDQCSHAFGLKQEAHLCQTCDRSWVKWEDFVRCQVRAKSTRRPSICLVSKTGMLFWMPRLLITGGPLLSLLWLAWVHHCHLMDHFDSKQCMESVDLPFTCHQSPWLTTFAFKSSEGRPLLLDLDPYVGTEPLGMFTLFFKRTADVLAACLSGKFPCLLETGQCHPYSEGSTVLLCCLLPYDFQNISIV